MNNHSKGKREFSDKTVDKAIKAACDHFKCKMEDLEIKIITKGSTGLFGLGGRKAIINAVPKKVLPAEQPLNREAPSGKPVEEEIGQEPKVTERKEEPEIPEQEQAAREQPAAASAGAGRESESSRKQTQKQKMEEISPELVEKQVSMACDIANNILEKSGLDGEAKIAEKNSRPYVDISGDDLSLIIGKEGRTLDALEYIINLCLKRKNVGIRYRITLEASGYRERRRKNLTSLSERTAIKVKKTGKPVSLQPMSARERRIVHVALRNFKGIKTHSSGDRGGRKVVISPIRNRKRPQKTRD